MAEYITRRFSLIADQILSVFSDLHPLYCYLFRFDFQRPIPQFTKIISYGQLLPGPFDCIHLDCSCKFESDKILIPIPLKLRVETGRWAERSLDLCLREYVRKIAAGISTDHRRLAVPCASDSTWCSSSDIFHWIGVQIPGRTSTLILSGSIMPGICLSFSLQRFIRSE